MSETRFDIRIVETTIYRKTYTRIEVIDLLAKAGRLTEEEKQRELGALDDAELMSMIEGDEAIEEDLQDEGDVEGSTWGVRVLSPGEDEYGHWPLS